MSLNPALPIVVAVVGGVAASLLSIAIAIREADSHRLVKPGIPFPETEAECRSHGGIWAEGGASRRYGCFLQTGDSGRACTDDIECEDICEAPAGAEYGTKTTGHCTGTRPSLGCHGRLRGGVLYTYVCVD